MNGKKFSLFIRLSRPVFLLAGIGQIFLGVGVARYLGRTIDWVVFFLSVLWIVLIQLAANYLNEYFDVAVDRYNENRTLFSGGSGVFWAKDEEETLSRQTALRAFVVTTSLAGAVTFTMVWSGAVGPAAGLLMALIFAGLVVYSTPPLRLSGSGYGEMLVAVIVGYLVPFLGYILQTGDLHRLLSLIGLPITFIALVFMLVISFPDYITDMKYGKRTFLVRAGWENVMIIHNSLILLAFVVLGSLVFFEFPPAILLPTFIAFPLGLLQIWQMRQIANGIKPNWTTLTVNAAALVGTIIYLLSYSFWTR
jgi:1,4-dihydroxy-2-naphthoate octaprenyltransferase